MNTNKPLLFLLIVMSVALLGYAVWSTQKSENSNSDKPIPTDIQVSSFEECVQAGYPVMESYPARCQTTSGQTFTQEIGNELEKIDLIKSENPRPNQEISSPLTLRGSARGNWYFEASFSAKLLDANGKVLAEGPMQAQGEWMTTNFVDYKGTLKFSTPTTDTGTLVLEKANPSGLATHDDSLRIPVKFAKTTATVPDPSKEFFQESDVYGFFGTVTLTGYLDIQKKVCNPGDMCGETVDYATFVFGNTDNSALKKFTGAYINNSFISGERVGLGCYQKDKSRIYYINFADSKNSARDTESFEGTITGSDLTKLLASTRSKPVQIKMTRPIYTSGQGAPDCYTHFRNFDVL